MTKLGSGSPETMILRLYIAGDTVKSRIAIDNLKNICHKHLKGHCTIEVIDITKHPDQAIDKNISALPTLIKELPLPMRTLIGDLASSDQVLVGLNIKRVDEEKKPQGKAKSPEELKVENEQLSKEIARLRAENDNLRLMLRKNYH
jgi:circadian clock protein KaiB